MNPQPGAAPGSPDPRDDSAEEAAPPRASSARRASEAVDAVLGKPEPSQAPQAPRAPSQLPHERDENIEEQRSGPRAEIEQAARDIESGQLDTDLHNTPGVERVVRERSPDHQADRDRQTAHRSADDLANKRGTAGGPERSHESGHNERKP